MLQNLDDQTQKVAADKPLQNQRNDEREQGKFQF